MTSDGVADLHDTEIAVLDELIAALEATDDLDTAVHLVRKGVKRLRAHLRLWKNVVDPGVYQSEDDDLARIGRALATARDSFVLGQTLDSLESSAGWDTAAGFIEAHHENVLDELRRGPLGEVRGWLGNVRARWLDLPERHRPAAVRAGVARSYRKGAAAYQAAAGTGQADAFHRWRKQVKYLRYQLEAIGGDTAVTATLTDLGVTLGFEHDLSVFIDFVDDNIDMLPDRRDRYVLIDRAEERRNELRASALGTDVYAEEPAAFVAATLA
jgi:CHAD domain-containing protein